MPRSACRRLLLLVIAALTTLAATALTAGSAAVATVPTGGVYVALGDSYTAGPLILPQSDLLTCARSSVDYPGLLARALQVATLRDVSCSGATSTDFTQSQAGQVSGTNPPQYDALSADTTLVTVGIGGNDIGLFGLAESCINVLPAPLGKSCAAKYTAGGVDVYSQKIAAFAATYATIIDTVHQRAPQAKVLMVGYPTAIRNGGCFPKQPILAPDATYIQAKIDELNAAMAQQAAAHGATYVDLRSSSVGHDACAASDLRWVEGIVPHTDAFPLHPNELSMQNATQVITAELAAG
jgi:lysophospholipase L1-like esterase